MNVFVYGTLKKGHGNHRLLENSRFIGEDSITGFDMYSTGGFPAVIPGDGVVFGELYEVTPEELESLHRLEGYRESDPDTSMYIPNVVETDGGHSCLTYIWNYDYKDLPRVEGGVW